ncbi:MAG TPA: hypothetical protein VI759_03395 [Dehalococcoidia bacterium]|nr:hypothetical protein [Dehalococcoidia bacterium]
MRILALGCSVPSGEVDHFDWASAHSFFDYDAIIVNPAEAVSKFIDEIVNAGASHSTFDESPITAGPTTAMAVGLADLLRRRRDETERLLARGGLVIVFTQPDVPHPDVPGFTGAHRYYWLPAPAGADYGPNYVKPASGRQVVPTDYEHPFATYLEAQHTSVIYKAIFTEGAAGFGQDAKVIGRSNGGAAIAMQIEVGGGHVVFLPAPQPHADFSQISAAATALVASIRNLLLQDAEETPPGWLRDYELPGIAEAHKRMTSAEDRLEELEAEFEEARNAYRAIDRYRRVLWQDGKYGFDLPVRDAFTALGFRNLAAIDEPATFGYGDETVFVETQSSSDRIDMSPHYRLRQRLEKQIAAKGTRARGIIVINGQRRYEPKDRAVQYEDALRVAAESMNYCVVTAVQLFEALREKLENKGSPDAFVAEMLSTNGVLGAPDIEPEPEPETTESTPLGETTGEPEAPETEKATTTDAVD